MMEKEVDKENLSKRGYWFEVLPDGRRVLCFKVRVHQRKFTQRLIVPKDVELKPAIV